jgi:protoporphyrinogen oxidase
MSQQKPTIGILGGGALGLAAAHELTKAGYSVTVIEKSNEKGGLAGCIKIGDSFIERFYHHFFLSDHAMLDLVKELNLEKELLWLESKMSFYSGGKVYAFGTPVSILQFSALSFINRLRFAFSSLYLSKLNDKPELHTTPAVDWIKKYGGEQVLKIIWEPLLIHKFGKNYKELPISWLWKRFQVRATSRDKSGTKEKLGYFKNSIAVFIEALTKRIEQQDGNFIYGISVKKIQQQEQKIKVETENETYYFDKVIATFAPEIFTRITEGLSNEYLQKSSELKYTGVVCPIFILNRQFSEYYWVNIGDPNLPFNGLIEQTNFLPKELYGNKYILYISNYCYTDHPNYNMPLEELKQVYIKGLQKVNPQFEESWIEEVIWSKAPYAQPVVTLNHQQKIPAAETNIKGLFNVNMTHIYPEDRGVNYSLRLGKEIARKIIETY